MIRTFDICINAAHPEVKLYEAATFIGSPSTAFVRGVPPAMGAWKVTAVRLAAAWPDGSIENVTATQTGDGVWTATLQGTDTSGRAENGLQILADGVDETGTAVTGYVLGIADLAVYTRDATIDVDGQSWYVRLFDSAPTPPHKGDAYISSGYLLIYDGAQWITIGGGGGGGIVDDTVTRTSSNAVKSSGIWSAIWGTLTALPTGFTALYDWVVSQLAGKLGTSGGTMTGTLKLKGTQLEFEDAETPADMGGIYVAGDTSVGGTVLRLVQWQNGGMVAAVALSAGNVATKADIPAAYTSTPSAPTASGSAGSSAAYSRGDHRHPTDTTRAPLGALADAFDQALGCSIGQLVTYAGQLYRSDGLPPDAPWDPTLAELVTIAEMLDLKLDVSGQFGGVRYAWGEGATGRALKLTVNQGLGSAEVYEFYRSDSRACSATCVARLGDLDGKVSGALGSSGWVVTNGQRDYVFASDALADDESTIARIGDLRYAKHVLTTPAGSATLLDRAVNLYVGDSTFTSCTFTLPEARDGKIRDFLLDVDNSANSSGFDAEFYGLGTAYALAVNAADVSASKTAGEVLAEMTSVEANTRARFYFTETAQTVTVGSTALPVISIQRMSIATATVRGGAA